MVYKSLPRQFKRERDGLNQLNADALLKTLLHV
jgi:hypothetical protein